MTMTCERFGSYSSSATREVILSRYRLNLLGLLLDHGQTGTDPISSRSPISFGSILRKGSKAVNRVA
jgi:hypothetical protein